MTRIAITGGPKTGKTTFAIEGMHHPVCKVRVLGGRECTCPCGGYLIRHTDDLIATHSWSEASQTVTAWLDEPGPWIIEGVAVSRALRKWRDQHPGERPPVDRVIYLSEPYEHRSAGQVTMAKGAVTVHAEVAPWLRAYGIHTEYPMTAHQVPRSPMGGDT